VKILLVDDEPALRELLRATFEGAHVEVDEAGTALEAEARIREQRPDVIVLDLHMPGMGGAELCTRLKGATHTKNIPIVVLTGADDEEARRATDCGAEALVRKPFSPLDLVAVVERLAGGERGLPARGPRQAPGEEEEVLLYARDLQHLLEVERAQRMLLQDSYLETVTALATALESRDLRTHAHSHRVERYAIELLAMIDSKRLIDDPGIRYGFLLHDIGKIGIPDGILQKPGPLTAEERECMQTHTLLGEQMLDGVAFLQGEGLRIVRSHHERWDGKGYPDKVAGADIPLGARVFALADSLDAMTSERPYRQALTWEAALEEISSERGKQFDPQVVDAFFERECELHGLQRELTAA
jgi:putative two-component system response regulator